MFLRQSGLVVVVVWHTTAIRFQLSVVWRHRCSRRRVTSLDAGGVWLDAVVGAPAGEPGAPGPVRVQRDGAAEGQQH